MVFAGLEQAFTWARQAVLFMGSKIMRQPD